MIASIDLTTSRADQLGLRQRLLGERPHRPLDGLFGLVGLRLEFFSQQRIEFRRLRRLRPPPAASCWDFGSAMAVLRSAVHAVHDDGSSAGFLVVRERLQQRRVLQQLAHQLLGAGLAVHVGDQIRELFAWLRAACSSASTLRATAAGEKSSMLSNVSSTLMLPSPVSVLGT